MTPCEKLGYKVGDRFEVVNSADSRFQKGETVKLFLDDNSGTPAFYSDRLKDYWYESLNNVRPLKPDTIRFITEPEQKGLTFGDVPFSALFVDNCGRLCQKKRSDEYQVIANQHGYLVAYGAGSVSSDDPIRKIYPFAKVEFS